MKKAFIVFLLILFFNSSSIYADNLLWYVSAALSKPAKKIAAEYNNTNKNDKIVIITGGTGELIHKILFSGKGDLFTPPSLYYKNFLDEKGLLLCSENLLIQHPVFALSKSGRKKIKSFDDLTKDKIKIAFGNERTMALGRICRKMEADHPFILKKLEKNKTVEALNILQIVNYLKFNIVDAGILFDAVARSNKLPYLKFPFPNNKNFFISTVNILKTTKSINKSIKMLNFIDKNLKIFSSFGFEIFRKTGRLNCK